MRIDSNRIDFNSGAEIFFFLTLTHTLDSNGRLLLILLPYRDVESGDGKKDSVPCVPERSGFADR